MTTTQENNKDNYHDSHNIFFGSKAFKFNSQNTPLGVTKLSVNITFAGAEIFVEEGIQVILVGQYLFGGVDFYDLSSGGIYSEIKESKYRRDEDIDRTVIIKANITFGAIDIKRLNRKD